ncbi:MAG: glycosyltransferase family 39 protein [Solirubrobacteraceae bacterium]|nr:glycosyltransferase family 39 protein [Solirubrobacteraceae bacterium]
MRSRLFPPVRSWPRPSAYRSCRCSHDEWGAGGEATARPGTGARAAKLASARRRELIAVAALALAAVAVWALVATYPSYDGYYHLVWGREILAGRAPSLDAYQAPTEHPLYLAVATLLAALVGDGADRAMVLLVALSLVALVWAVFRTGRAVFGQWAGIVAALLTGSSFALLLYAARAYVDIPFLALVMWAAALEAERPRRGAAVTGLLAVAGLLRPEAWLLALASWAWCAWPRDGAGARRLRPGLLALALAAPLAWALVDLAATGDPLWSLHATSELADELGRERGVEHVPGALVSFLADVLRPPVFVASLAGLGLALRRRSALALHVPLALLGAGLLTFLATGVAGLSILPRYLTVPALALTLFAGWAATGWLFEPGGSTVRRGWTRAVAILALAGLAFVAARATVVTRFVDEVRFIGGVHEDLVATLADPAVRRARSCGPLTLPNYRLVPDTRWILDAPRSKVGARSAKRRDHGVALFFTDDKTLRRYGYAAGASRSTNVPDPGFEPIARHGRVAAYAACP